MTSASGKRRVRTAFFAVVLLAALATILWPKYGPLLDAGVTCRVEAGPLLVHDAAGEPVLATLLVRDQPRWTRSLIGGGTQRVVELQLNRISDAGDLGRVFVHGTSSSHGGLSVSLLGAEADRVWLFADGVRAVSVSRRELELDPAALETRVPQLQGQLRNDHKLYEFAPESGLRITARDGAAHVLNTRTWKLAPASDATPPPPQRDSPEAQRVSHDRSAGTGEEMKPMFAQVAGEYGLDSCRAGDQWFGILSQDEQRRCPRSWDRPRKHPSGDPERRKVWTAAIIPSPDGSGQLTDMRAVRDNTYLRGGFLRDGKHLRPVQEKGSPDLIVEHYTGVADSAQMLLTRMTPDGEVRWDTLLPLKLPNTIRATDEYVAFLGLPPRTAAVHRAQLVCLRLKDGSFRTFAFN